MQVNIVTVAGAGQFTDTLISNFGVVGGIATEYAALGGTQRISQRPLLFWMSYDAQGSAHNLRVFLAQGAGVTEDLLTPIFDSATVPVTLTHWSLISGKGGCLNVWLDPLLPWELRVTTTGKDDDATFRLAWGWDNLA